MFYGSPYSVSQDGTLGGHYLNAEHSGSYQCFVKDEVTGVEVFSRRLRVAVTGRCFIKLIILFYFILLASPNKKQNKKNK